MLSPTHAYPRLRYARLTKLLSSLRCLNKRPLETRVRRWHRAHETSKRLDEIPGVGPALVTALVASIADPKPIPLRP